MNVNIQIATLHPGEQARLRSAVNERVRILSRKEPGSRQVLYRSLYRSIKECYQVDSYKDLKQSQLQDALKFIYGWGGEALEART